MTDRYAVVGHPIAHSKSPLIHRLFAEATGQDLRYDALDGGPDRASFHAVLQSFRQAGGRGLNVTLPFKLAALELADDASEDARLAGAANTLRFDGEQVLARNTDGSGLVRDVQANLGVDLQGRRVLVLGAGGAARGILLPLARAGAVRLVLANRTLSRAEELVRDLGAADLPLQAVALADAAAAGPFDVVFNATAASLHGRAPALPPAALAGSRLAYDLVYGQGLTPFLAQARAAGVPQLADGLGMLVEQAAEAFAWWRGVRPPTEPVRARLSRPLQAATPEDVN